MIIKNNSNANQALRQSQINTGQAGKAMQKLSSGLRINQAADDAAGLAISEKMRAQIRGLDQAAQNAVDGISLIQTGEGGLNESHSILQRMRELAVQSANDTNNLADRGAIQKEFNEMTSELNRIGNQSSFNSKAILTGIHGSEGEVLTTHSIPGHHGAVRGLYKVSVDPTRFSNGDTLSIDGYTFTKSTSYPLGQEEFNDLPSLRNSILSHPDLSKSYNVQVGIMELQLEQRTGKETSTLPQVMEFRAVDGSSSGYMIDVIRNGRSGPPPQSGKFELNEKDIMPLIKGDIIKVEWVSDISFNNKSFELSFDPHATSMWGGVVNSFAEVVQGINNIASPYTSNSHWSGSSVTIQENHPYEGTYKQLKLTRGGKEITLQIGANDNQSMQLDMNDMRAGRIGLTSTIKGEEGFTSERVVKNREGDRVAEYALNIMSQTGASQAISKIDQAIQLVSSERAKMGSWQNRLDHIVANVTMSSENLQAAESRIRDVDMAKEMMAFTKSNILGQASQAMIAQANKQPEAILQLLR